MLIVGLTGGLGTGKSTVAAMFAKHGAVVIDADAITRDLLQPGKKCFKKVAKLFPDAILSSRLDRQALASIVFQDSHNLKQLTDLLHPQAFKEIQKRISLNRNKPLIILDVPLLFEAGWEKIVDTTVAVKALRRQLTARLKRKGFSSRDITRRLQAQMPLSEKVRRADIVINNQGSRASTQRQVDAVVHRLLHRKTKQTRRKE